MNKKHCRILTILTAFAVLFCCVCSIPAAETVSAAASVSKVSGLTAKKTAAKTVKLSWKKVSGAKKYEVYSAKAKANGKAGKYASAKTVSKTSVSLSGQSGTRFYKVRAVKGSKKGAFSSAKKVSFNASGLAQVKGLTVTQSAKSEVTMQWKQVKGAKKYQIYACDAKTNGKEGTYHLIYATEDNKVMLEGQSGFKYYKVRAVKGNKKGDFSAAKAMYFIYAQLIGINFPTAGLTAPVMQFQITNTSKKHTLYITGRGANSRLALYDKQTGSLGFADLMANDNGVYIPSFASIYYPLKWSMCQMSNPNGSGNVTFAKIAPGKTANNIYIQVMGNTDIGTNDIYDYYNTVEINGQTYKVTKAEMSGTMSYGGKYIKDAVTNVNSPYIPIVNFYYSYNLKENGSNRTEGISYDKLWMIGATTDVEATQAAVFK